MRVGFGVDAHRFGGPGPLRIGGVIIDPVRGVEATSDGDVAIHALIDALLGAAALGDLGTHFPSSDEQWHGAASLDLLARTREMIAVSGYTILNVDVTVVSQSVRIAPHRQAIRTTVSDVLRIEPGCVSIKATSTDGLGFTGRDEGIAAMAVAAVR